MRRRTRLVRVTAVTASSSAVWRALERPEPEADQQRLPEPERPALLHRPERLLQVERLRLPESQLSTLQHAPESDRQLARWPESESEQWTEPESARTEGACSEDWP